jgi:hypothetical protein
LILGSNLSAIVNQLEVLLVGETYRDVLELDVDSS